jgi:uncharacterized protein
VKKLCRHSKVLTAACVVIFAVTAASSEDPNKLAQPTSYVTDLAGVIDAESARSMEDLSHQVYEKAHATIEVVTVKSLDGSDIDSFTTALEDHWKVGAKGTDKGVLMVFAVAEHKDRIEVGYGLEGVLNDAKVGDIRRSMHDQLASGELGPGILFGERQLADVIAKDANVTLDQTAPMQQPMQRPATQRRRGSGWPTILIFLFVILIFTRGGRGGGWLWFLLGNMMGGGFGGGGGRSGDGGGGGGGDFGGGFGGGSGGGGASGDW